MVESLKLTITVPAKPKEVYKAWMSSAEHTEFTGEQAKIDPKVGGKFTAFGDYISGENLELKPGKLIAQSWRTTEYPDGHEDSRLEILFEEVKGGTKVTLVQTNIPRSQGTKYKSGWKEFYLQPLKRYFAERQKE